MNQHEMKFKKYRRFILGLLVYTFIIILWGAWVRISGSGDGCGSSWPLCKGEILPEFEKYKTLIEFTHRAKSGLYGFLILGLYLWARKLFPKKHWGRRAAFASFIFTISEALLGAKLVLLGLVGSNDSMVRAFSMSLHMMNSLLLSGSLILAWVYATEKSRSWRQNSKQQKWLAGLTVAAIFTIATTGAFAALAATLFPTESLLTGISADFAPDSHPLIRLRILHPILAISLGFALIFYAWSAAQEQTNLLLKKRGQILGLTITTQIIFGLVTLFTHSPVWMKLVHLQLAHLVWISLILVLTETLTQNSDQIS